MGKYGVIYHYDGDSWREQESPVQTMLFDVTGFDSDEVYATGEEGVVLRYDGDSWRRMDSPPEGRLRSAWTTEDGRPFVLSGDAIYRFDSHR